MASKLNRLMYKGSREPRRSVPVKQHRELRILDKTRPLQCAPEDMGWLVVMVAPQQEERACIALSEAGYTAWRPQTTVWITSARLRVKSKVNRPLFPRYVFVTGGHAATKGIRQCDHVTYIVGDVAVPPRGRPSFIAELSRRQQLGEYDATFERPRFVYEPGMQVIIDDGSAFNRLAGIVERSEQERVFILLEILGRKTRVEVDAGSLQVA